MAFDSKIERVQVQIMDLDLECFFDIANGRGIRISSVESFDPKKKNEKIWNGLQSEFFGTDFSEEDAFRERWSCKCNTFVAYISCNRYACNKILKKQGAWRYCIFTVICHT